MCPGTLSRVELTFKERWKNQHPPHPHPHSHMFSDNKSQLTKDPVQRTSPPSSRFTAPSAESGLSGDRNVTQPGLKALPGRGGAAPGVTGVSPHQSVMMNSNVLLKMSENWFND